VTGKNGIAIGGKENVEFFSFGDGEKLTYDSDEEIRQLSYCEKTGQLLVVCNTNIDILEIGDEEIESKGTHSMKLADTLESYATEGEPAMSCYWSAIKNTCLCVFITNNEGETQQLMVFEVDQDSVSEIRNVEMDAFDDEFIPLWEAGIGLVNSVMCPWAYESVNIVTGEWDGGDFDNGKITDLKGKYLLYEAAETLYLKEREIWRIWYKTIKEYL